MSTFCLFLFCIPPQLEVLFSIFQCFCPFGSHYVQFGNFFCLFLDIWHFQCKRKDIFSSTHPLRHDKGFLYNDLWSVPSAIEFILELTKKYIFFVNLYKSEVKCYQIWFTDFLDTRNHMLYASQIYQAMNLAVSYCI